MNVAVVCEESAEVREAFRRRGHHAVSFDLGFSRRPGPHVRGDVRETLDQSGFDLFICFPPCTYLCSMGIWWNHKRPQRWHRTECAAEFFEWCYNLPGLVCVENPIGIMSTRFRRPDQIINPWQFGHEATKPTCLWLKGLPLLAPTKIVGKGEFYTKANGKRASKWSHKMSGTRKHERARIASKTFRGIAEAMAEQWGSLTPARVH